MKLTRNLIHSILRHAGFPRATAKTLPSGWQRWSKGYITLKIVPDPINDHVALQYSTDPSDKAMLERYREALARRNVESFIQTYYPKTPWEYHTLYIKMESDVEGGRHECPTCKQVFSTRRGLSAHHTWKHLPPFQESNQDRPGHDK